MHDTTDRLQYDPFSPEAMHDPFPLYRELRSRSRAYRLPQYDAWAIPRFEDVWQLAANRSTTIFEGPVFSREKLLGTPPEIPTANVHRPLASFSTLDPPIHTAIRKAAFAPFRPPSVSAISEPLRADVNRLLADAIERGSFDVVADLASPAVAASTCRLLGLPVVDHGMLNELVNRSVQRDPGAAGVGESGALARRELHEYLVDWTRAHRGWGGMVDALASVDAGADPLSDEEVATQVSTILVGGMETVPKIVAGGVLQLWRHPDQRAALAADPTLLDGACEEIMRLEAPLQWIGRTLAHDAEIAGTEMSAGQRLFLLLASANRDEHEFEDPDHFDINRRPTRTLVFGHGTHFCIGAAPARLELQVLIEEFVSHVTDYDVDLDHVIRPPSEFQLGYTALPVSCVR